MNIVKRCTIGVIYSLFMMFSVLGSGPTFQAQPGAVMTAAQNPPPQPAPDPQQYGQPGMPSGAPVVGQYGVPAGGQPAQYVAPGFSAPPGGPPVAPPANGAGVAPIVDASLATQTLNASQPQGNGGSGNTVSLPCFERNGDGLVKVDKNPRLKRALAVCVGDWCPHCANFLSVFARYIEILNMYKINIIFVHIPTLEVLSNWHDPTMEDYQSAAAKLQQFGIKLDDPEDKSKQASVQLVMLGSKEALSVIGVSALPTVFGSVDSKECLRYVGDQVLSSLNLADPATLTSFLKLFDKSSDDKSADDTSKKKADKSGGSKAKKGKGGASAGKAAGSLKVDLISASRATAILNGEVFPFSLSSTPIKHRSSGCSCRLH